MRNTKIVCTIGPACEKPEQIQALIEAGMNVARLNMSHSSHQYHAELIKNIRAVSSSMDRTVGILMDLQGPKIRIGTLKEKVILEKGQRFILTTRNVPGNAISVSVSLDTLPESVSPGQRILIDDGLLELNVENIAGADIYTSVVRGGELKDRKGINLPEASIKTPSITGKDKDDLAFGIEQDVDMVALSFVRTAADVLELKGLMEEHGTDIPVIAKIEKHEAVRNIDSIMEVSQGIMVARGDLGIEIPIADVPIVQKMIIAKANESSIPVITATQMLDSMIRNPIPTRAEVTDVANAVFDGTDALMLSGETAFGEYPVKSVETMAKTALNAESSHQYRSVIAGREPHPSMSITDSIAYTSVEAARNLKAQAIITATQSGLTARKVSRYKPEVPVIAVTTSQKVMNQLSLSYGIVPVQVAHSTRMASLVDDALARCTEKGLVNTGDLLVITAGILTEVTGGTNIMRIHVMANVLARGEGIGKGVIKGKVQLSPDGHIKPSDDTRIIVVNSLTSEQAEQLSSVKAVITTEPGLTSPTAHHCRENQVPIITGVADAPSIFTDDQDITIDLLRGIIYDGIINLPGD